MKLYEESAIAGFSRKWNTLYEQSNTKIVWDSFGEAPDPAGSSIYKRFLTFIELLLGKFSDAIRDSFLDRIFGSELIKRLFFVCFAMYLPIEYVLRDMLRLSIASVWEEAFICAGIFLVLWRTLTKRGNGCFSRATSLEVFLLLYIAIGLLLMSINAPFPRIAFAGFRAQYEYVIWFFIIIRLIDSREDARFVIYSFLAVAALLSLHGIYQFIVAVPIPASWTTQTEMSVRTRVFSITGSPNIFGSFLILAAPSAAALMYYSKDTRQKIFFLGVTGMICLSDLFTFSRGSWVGLVAAIVIFAAYVDRRLIIAMLTAMAAILSVVPSIAQRIAFLFTDAYAEASAIGGRALRWELGKTLLHENSPWIGFGLGRFGGAVAMNNQILDKTEEFSYFYMDNYYLKVLVESGYLGLITFILCFAVFIILALKAIHKAGQGYISDRSKDQLMRNAGNDMLLAVGLFSGMCGVMLHCYFENIFEEPYMMSYFWGLAAVLLSFGFNTDKA